MHEGCDAAYSLYDDHPRQLAGLAAAEAAPHPELEIAALVGDAPPPRRPAAPREDSSRDQRED